MNMPIVSHRRVAITGILVLCIALVLTNMAGAAPAAVVPLMADAVVVKSLPNTHFGTADQIGVTGTTPPSSACGSAAESYLRFNLSGLDPIKGAALTVNAIGLTGGSMIMHLWGISTADSGTWYESDGPGVTGITWNNKPSVDLDLITTASAAATGSIVFSGSSAFVNYLESRRQTANATATIVIKMDSCLGASVEQVLGSKENLTAALHPRLDVSPTVVTLSTFMPLILR